MCDFHIQGFFSCQYMSSRALKFNFKPSTIPNSHDGNNNRVWPRKAGKMGNFPIENEEKFLGGEWKKSISRESPRLWKHPAKAHRDTEKWNGNMKALLGWGWAFQDVWDGPKGRTLPWHGMWLWDIWWIFLLCTMEEICGMHRPPR